MTLRRWWTCEWITDCPQIRVSFLTLKHFSLPRCWITDHDINYIVNVGYYVLVFLFTFTTFIVMISWRFCLRKANTSDTEACRNLTMIMGLCCILGVMWGFMFFANGVLRVPAFYIFTFLSSFQGNCDSAAWNKDQSILSLINCKTDISSWFWRLNQWFRGVTKIFYFQLLPSEGSPQQIQV